jgi:demethylmenaquinone methyltransferase/2-methoxy-6-polyprenyl-1,4-benzoquinol methylase
MLLACLVLLTELGFWAFMTNSSMLTDRNRLSRRIFKDLPSRYDRLAEVFSFGQNRRWQTAMLQPVLSAHPNCCLDVATGTASVAIRLANSDGDRRVFGIDLSTEMLSAGRQRTLKSGLDVGFALARAEELPFQSSVFDTVTFTYLLRYVEDPTATLGEMVRVLKDGGVLSSLEFFVPPNPVLRGLWVMYTRAMLPAAGRIFGREWYDVGRFLGPSISEHYRRFPLEDHLLAWRNAGIRSPRYRLMSMGGGLIMWGKKE